MELCVFVYWRVTLFVRVSGVGVFMCIFFFIYIAALEVKGPGPGPDSEIVHDEC